MRPARCRRSPGFRFLRSTLGTLLCLQLTATAISAAGQEVSGTEIAARFARLFMSGEHDQAEQLLDATMRAVFPPEKMAALVGELISAHGEVRELGEAWHEDDVQIYRRYRVPVSFRHATLDLRVVLGRSDDVAGLFVVEHIEPPAKEPSGAVSPGDEIELRIGPEGRSLPAILTLPRERRPCPGVLFVHGSGPLDRDETVGPNKPFRDLAWGLARHGIASLRYDKRAFAHPEEMQAMGERLTVEANIVADAVHALETLRSRPEIDTEMIFLLGHSLGGFLAPRIAAASPAKPAGLVLLAANARPPTVLILDQTRYIVTLDGEVSQQEQIQMHEIEKQVISIRNAVAGQGEPPEGLILGAPYAYWKDLELYDGPSRAADLGLPILLLQGKRDYQVTREDYELWVATLSTYPDVCFHAYDDVDHLFRRVEGRSSPEDYLRAAPVERRVIDDIAAWIESAWCP